MADMQSNMEIRRQIAQAQQDMDRATERASEACRGIGREIVFLNAPTEVNLDVIEGGKADLRDAQSAYKAALKRKQELKALLGED